MAFRWARLRVMVSAESLVQDGVVRRYTERRTETLRTVLTAAVAKGIADGELDTRSNPRLVATEIVAFMEGIQVRWMLAPGAIDLVEAYGSYFASLVERLRA